MNKPWLIFAGLCAVVLAIVMLCVIFGSYTSMLRSKNRINTGKDLMVAACHDQLDLVLKMASRVPENIDGQVLSRIQDTAGQIQPILIGFQASDAPLAPNLVTAFENAQALLAKDLDILAREIGDTHPLIREMSDLYLKTIYSAKRYNREAAYFHTRKTVFPGIFTAGWFNLDELDFPQIDLTCFDPWGLK